MMSCVPLETCSAFNKLWNNKFYYKAASCWYFYWVLHIVPCIIFCNQSMKAWEIRWNLRTALTWIKLYCSTYTFLSPGSLSLCLAELMSPSATSSAQFWRCWLHKFTTSTNDHMLLYCSVVKVWNLMLQRIKRMMCGLYILFCLCLLNFIV